MCDDQVGIWNFPHAPMYLLKQWPSESPRATNLAHGATTRVSCLLMAFLFPWDFPDPIGQEHGLLVPRITTPRRC